MKQGMGIKKGKDQWWYFLYTRFGYDGCQLFYQRYSDQNLSTTLCQSSTKIGCKNLRSRRRFMWSSYSHIQEVWERSSRSACQDRMQQANHHARDCMIEVFALNNMLRLLLLLAEKLNKLLSQVRMVVNVIIGFMPYKQYCM